MIIMTMKRVMWWLFDRVGDGEKGLGEGGRFDLVTQASRDG